MEKKASELLSESAVPFDKACILVQIMETELMLFNELREAAQSTYKWKQYRQKVIAEQSDRMGRKLSFSSALRYKCS